MKFADLYFLHISEVLNMLYHRSVGQVDSKKFSFLFLMKYQILVTMFANQKPDLHL